MNDAMTYDALLEAGCDPVVPCPVCTGDKDAEPCSEECERSMDRLYDKRRIARLYRWALLSLRLAQLYKTEGFEGDHRIPECIRQVNQIRQMIRDLRTKLHTHLQASQANSQEQR